MRKLTRKTAPENMIRYVSTAERYELVQKLGAIEHGAEDLLNQVCGRVCRFQTETDLEELDSICMGCPLRELAEVIGV